jgi:hypothetical protein
MMKDKGSFPDIGLLVDKDAFVADILKSFTVLQTTLNGVT